MTRSQEASGSHTTSHKRKRLHHLCCRTRQLPQGAERWGHMPRFVKTSPSDACHIVAQRAVSPHTIKQSSRRRLLIGTKTPPSRHDTDGARGETRTHTLLPTADFESAASANSATRARHGSIVAYGAAIAAHGFQLAQWCDAFRYRRNHVPQRSPPPSGYQMDPKRTPSHGGVSSASNRLLATMRQGSRLPK